MDISRRSFLSGLLAAGTVAAAGSLAAKPAEAATSPDSWATLIDLTKCDGCEGKPQPACITACRTKNAARFPVPDPKMLKDYWPQKTHEDWSSKKGLTNRLTPYNWIFVQKLEVEHDGRKETVSVPRRCMHCDNPACVKLCPFGANNKDTNGPVWIDEASCLGGAKCRTVCPWGVPQRQAGVGIYTALDPIPAGGGVMYKCDLCRDLLKEGKQPACIPACPKQALSIGPRKEIFAQAEALKAKYNGHVYGMQENGGTSTLYVSRVPFEAIDKAILASVDKPEKAMRMHKPKNKLEDSSELITAALAAPFAGMLAAYAATVTRANKKEEPSDE